MGCIAGWLVREQWVLPTLPPEEVAVQSWLKVFTTEGAGRDVAGNTPLLLDDSQSVWLVGSGRLEVFAVPSTKGGIDGARLPLFSAEPGELLFGVSLETLPGQNRLLAVGNPGTRVYQLRRERLEKLAGHEDLVSELAALLGGWIQRLTAGVAVGQTPRKVTLVEPGQEVQLPDYGVVSSIRGTVWVRHLQGATRFLGRAELPLGTSDELFPVSGAGWLVAAEDETRLAAIATEDLLAPMDADGRRKDEQERSADSTFQVVWSGLDRFHRAIQGCVLGNIARAHLVEHRRLRRRRDAERLLLGGAMSRLAGVTQPGEVDDFGEEGLQTDPLLVACRLLGTRLGIAFELPLGLGESRKRSDPVSAIARASRVRVRRVLLAGDWWRQDNGPLLAYLAENERPVALLPMSPSRYELVDPTTETRTPVTAANAGAVLPFGYTFYRPFASRPLGPWDLVRFGMLGSRRDWLFVILFGLAASLVGMFTPLVTGWVFDQIIPGAQRNQLLLVVLTLTVSALAIGLFQFTRGIAILRLETKMGSAVEAGIWDRLLNLPVPFFRRYTAGDLSLRALGIGAIRQVLTDVALSAVLSFVFSLVYFGLLFYYDGRLALLACGLFAIILLATGLSAFVQLRYQRGISQARGKITGLVLQMITGIARLRVAGAETRALAVWAREFSVQRKHTFQARSIANNLGTFTTVLPVLSSMALFATVSMLPEGKLSLGAFLAFNVAFVQILAAAIMMSTVIGYAVEVVPLCERAKPILESLPEATAVKAIPFNLSGDIEIGHVSFRYHLDGPLILNDVSLHIRPGEFVALVGPSGAGKSTVLRLLLGFENPTLGSIYYDREDLARLDCQAVRRQIGVVLQDSKLMAGDIFTNITGSSLLSLEDAWEAARLSGLAEDIKQMPMGMQTVVSEGGSTLSGGQRQRLMIARAIVSKPKILLFDEATGALDNETQASVSRSLDNLKATRVVVAHRLSTVRHADRICVVEGGRIVQQGRYEDLMQQGGLFAELVQRQLI
jgi:NHLM bacteriocin system ABC transporter ATP-binding protein